MSDTPQPSRLDRIEAALERQAEHNKRFEELIAAREKSQAARDKRFEELIAERDKRFYELLAELEKIQAERERFQAERERLQAERDKRFDERLERLTERQESLAQAFELSRLEWQDRWADITAALRQDAENIRALARIAEIHDRRLSDLEGQ